MQSAAIMAKKTATVACSGPVKFYRTPAVSAKQCKTMQNGYFPGPQSFSK
jgi:hypothetical protein